MSPTETTRRHAIALSDCTGWTEWVLPRFQQTLGRMEASLLDSPSLTEPELAKLRVEYQELKRFLKGLDREVREAFGALSDEVRAVQPESVRDRVFQAFATSPRPAAAPAATSPPADIAPLAFPAAPTFNPFAGTPAPAESAPAKSKPKKASPPKKARRKRTPRSA